MHKRTWQKLEGRIAGFFGSLRVPGSGSMGRRDLGSDDSTHPRIYLECKARQRFELVTLWKDSARKAAAEGKPLTVVAIRAVSRAEANEDFLLIPLSQFDAVAAERMAHLRAVAAGERAEARAQETSEEKALRQERESTWAS